MLKSWASHKASNEVVRIVRVMSNFYCFNLPKIKAYNCLLTDVTHPFFKINELQFSEFATAIDSSERLRNISY